MIYNQNISLDLNTRTPNLIIGAKQFDNNSRSITATILENGNIINIPSNAEVTYRIQKPNGRCEWNRAELLKNENKIRILFSNDDLSQAGRNIVDVLITVGTFSLGTTNFILDVQNAPSIADMQEDSESVGYLEQIVGQAHEVIAQAQAWAEGKRGDEEIVTDDYEIGAPSHINVSLDFATFKSNIVPNDSGTTVDYTFTYSDEGWVYISYFQEGTANPIAVNTVVNMELLGFTITLLGGQGLEPNIDTITVHASFADEAYNNNAKYYANVALEAAEEFNVSLASLTDDISGKLDIPISSSVAPSNPKIGDLWVDTNGQFQLNGRIVGSENIKYGAVTGSHIDERTIYGNNIILGAIGNDLLSYAAGAEAVTNSVIRDHTVEGVKIASHTLTEYNFGENIITDYSLASSAVNSNILASGAVYSKHFTTGAVTSAAIGSGAVTSVALAPSCVMASNIANGVVTKEKLNSNFVESGVLAAYSNGTYQTLSLISNNAAAAFVFISGNNSGGVIRYICTSNGNTSESVAIGTSSNLTLIPNTVSGVLKIRNDGTYNAFYTVLKVAGTITTEVQSES